MRIFNKGVKDINAFWPYIKIKSLLISLKDIDTVDTIDINTFISRISRVFYTNFRINDNEVTE